MGPSLFPPELLGKDVRLRAVRLLDPLRQREEVTDVWLQEGRLRASEPAGIPAEIPTLDGSGWVLGPGLLDLYAHSGEMVGNGLSHSRETLASLAAAALAGGFAQVALLPAPPPGTGWFPVLDRPEHLNRYPRQPGDPRWLPLAALSVGGQGETPTPWGELAQAGAVGFAEVQPLRSLALLRRALEYLRLENKPLLLWAWDPSLAGQGSLYEGIWALRLGLKGIPASAETAALARLLEVIRTVPSPPPVHIMRLSQARSLEMIQQAQAEGLPLTASTSWMHLILSEEAVREHRYDPHLRLLPPLPSAADRAALVAGIRSGSLGIATDHHPYTYEEKTLPFADAPPGAMGLELALPLLWQHLVATGSLTPLQLWSALSLYPARCLNLDPPTLTPHSNWVLFDPAHPWTVSAATLHSRSHATPWLEKPLRGKVLYTHIEHACSQPTPALKLPS
ncbi:MULTISPECIES: dihydroorotase [unclassified Synechococcus]|uniref:dihydroorotase n=1 Tax=unclassified Synechococcus TaxID=2626047 RepID=UPI0039C26BFF